MKTNKRSWLCLGLTGVLCGSAGTVAAATIYSQDFSAVTLAPNVNGYIGGFFTPQVGFQTWNGPGEASIAAGGLTVAPTSGIRSAGIVLAPALFTGAGSYTLTFDVTAYSGDANDDNGLVRVWGVRGYDLSLSSGNAIIVDTLSAQATPQGTASVTALGTLSFITPGVGRQIGFNYNGTDAVALFFGANTGGFPFPTVTYDNISLTNVAIPESGGGVVLAAGAGAACLIRRRRR